MNSPRIFRRRLVTVGLPVLAMAATVVAVLAKSAPASAANKRDVINAAAELEAKLKSASGSPLQHCQIDYLKQLGWQIIPSTRGAAEIRTGNPCDDATLSKSRANGELQIELPDDASGPELEAVLGKLPELVGSVSSRCAYKHQVADAAVRAITKLQENGKYRFVRRVMPLGFVDFGVLGGKRKGWEPQGPKVGGFAYQPREKNSTAIQTFYDRRVHLECAAGLQLAEFATQYELYGAEDFDQAFRNDEIVIGTWHRVGNSNSATRGNGKGRAVVDRWATHNADLGGKSLVGRTGYLGNVFGEDYLDAKSDRGENLMIVSVSDAASKSIIAAGGLHKFNKEMREIWDLHTEIATLEDLNLDLAKNSPVRAENDRMIKRKWTEINKIYQDPFYTGILTYTHPFPEMKTFRGQLERLWDLNPRTPYRLHLYEDVINEGLYERHANHFIGKCLKSTPSVPEALVRPARGEILTPVESKLIVPAPSAPAAPEMKPVGLTAPSAALVLPEDQEAISSQASEK